MSIEPVGSERIISMQSPLRMWRHGQRGRLNLGGRLGRKARVRVFTAVTMIIPSSVVR
jgi:hypothetical protein